MKKLLSVTDKWLAKKYEHKMNFVSTAKVIQSLIKEHKITTKKELETLLENY